MSKQEKIAVNRMKASYVELCLALTSFQQYLFDHKIPSKYQASSQHSGIIDGWDVDFDAVGLSSEFDYLEQDSVDEFSIQQIIDDELNKLASRQLAGGEDVDRVLCAYSEGSIPHVDDRALPQLEQEALKVQKPLDAREERLNKALEFMGLIGGFLSADESLRESVTIFEGRDADGNELYSSKFQEKDFLAVGEAVGRLHQGKELDRLPYKHQVTAILAEFDKNKEAIHQTLQAMQPSYSTERKWSGKALVAVQVVLFTLIFPIGLALLARKAFSQSPVASLSIFPPKGLTHLQKIETAVSNVASELKRFEAVCPERPAVVDQHEPLRSERVEVEPVSLPLRRVNSCPEFGARSSLSEVLGAETERLSSAVETESLLSDADTEELDGSPAVDNTVLARSAPSTTALNPSAFFQAKDRQFALGACRLEAGESMPALPEVSVM